MEKPGKKRARVTLADVAREARLSVQTVSHVLANNMTVRLPEATRERVREAALKVGYRPNRLAQAMRRGSTHIVGVWMPIDRPILAYMRYLQLINELVRRDGYDLMIFGLDSASALKKDGSLPALWPVDGIISLDAGKAIERFRAEHQEDSTPIAILGREQVSNSDSISWKVDEAMYRATMHLSKLGRKRIVHLTMDWILADFPNEQRRRGYEQAMNECGLEPVYVSSPGESSSIGEQAMLEFLAHNERPDGVTAFTDPLAIGAMRALLNSEIQIPEQAEVIGFGDYPEGEDFKVPLSTLRVPQREVIAQAWKWLRERIEDPGLESRVVELDLELVIRESCRGLE